MIILKNIIAIITDPKNTRMFLLGGIAVNYLLPAPKWFTILDLTLSYLPMAYFGGFLASFYSKKVMK